MKINEMIRELRIKKVYTRTAGIFTGGLCACGQQVGEGRVLSGHYAAACAGPCIRYGFKHTAFF